MSLTVRVSWIICHAHRMSILRTRVETGQHWIHGPKTKMFEAVCNWKIVYCSPVDSLPLRADLWVCLSQVRLKRYGYQYLKYQASRMRRVTLDMYKYTTLPLSSNKWGVWNTPADITTSFVALAVKVSKPDMNSTPEATSMKLLEDLNSILVA